MAKVGAKYSRCKHQMGKEQSAYPSMNQANPKRQNEAGTFGSLTSRQTYILGCLVNGLTCKEIAGRLHIRTRSVYLQTALLKAKFGAQTLAQLVSRASECGENQSETNNNEGDQL
jgi:DNA-binding NarL/FixJ family response regulator